jgi:hypothetical protein
MEEISEYKVEINIIVKKLVISFTHPIFEFATKKLTIDCLNVCKHIFHHNVFIVEEEKSKEEKAHLSMPLKIAFVLKLF